MTICAMSSAISIGIVVIGVQGLLVTVAEGVLVGDNWVVIVGEGDAIVTDGVETGEDGRMVGESLVVTVGIGIVGDSIVGSPVGEGVCKPLVFFWMRKNKRIASIPVTTVRTSKSMVLNEELPCFVNFSTLMFV